MTSNSCKFLQLISSFQLPHVVPIHFSEKRNYQFSVKDILDWEEKHGIIAENSIVLIDTGSSKFWPNRKEYMGTDERGQEGVKKLKFPGIHPEAAKFLATKRKIKAVGLDTPSIDFGGSKLFKTHQILSEKNIPGIENVANLNGFRLTLMIESGASNLIERSWY